jgi:hypothetical protein
MHSGAFGSSESAERHIRKKEKVEDRIDEKNVSLWEQQVVAAAWGTSQASPASAEAEKALRSNPPSNPQNLNYSRETVSKPPIPVDAPESVPRAQVNLPTVNEADEEEDDEVVANAPPPLFFNDQAVLRPIVVATARGEQGGSGKTTRFEELKLEGEKEKKILSKHNKNELDAREEREIGDGVSLKQAVEAMLETIAGQSKVAGQGLESDENLYYSLHPAPTFEGLEERKRPYSFLVNPFDVGGKEKLS